MFHNLSKYNMIDVLSLCLHVPVYLYM